jgi:hypothetical protein
MPAALRAVRRGPEQRGSLLAYCMHGCIDSWPRAAGPTPRTTPRAADCNCPVSLAALQTRVPRNGATVCARASAFGRYQVVDGAGGGAGGWFSAARAGRSAVGGDRFA